MKYLGAIMKSRKQISDELQAALKNFKKNRKAGITDSPQDGLETLVSLEKIALERLREDQKFWKKVVVSKYPSRKNVIDRLENALWLFDQYPVNGASFLVSLEKDVLVRLKNDQIWWKRFQ